MADTKGTKIIVENRKARHDYFVEEVYESGIALYGTEVKSIRKGTVNLKDSYCEISTRCAYISVRTGQYFQPRSPSPEKIAFT